MPQETSINPFSFRSETNQKAHFLVGPQKTNSFCGFSSQTQKLFQNNLKFSLREKKNADESLFEKHLPNWSKLKVLFWSMKSKNCYTRTLSNSERVRKRERHNSEDENHLCRCCSSQFVELKRHYNYNSTEKISRDQTSWQTLLLLLREQKPSTTIFSSETDPPKKRVWTELTKSQGRKLHNFTHTHRDNFTRKFTANNFRSEIMTKKSAKARDTNFSAFWLLFGSELFLFGFICGKKRRWQKPFFCQIFFQTWLQSGTLLAYLKSWSSLQKDKKFWNCYCHIESMKNTNFVLSNEELRKRFVERKSTLAQTHDFPKGYLKPHRLWLHLVFFFSSTTKDATRQL